MRISDIKAHLEKRISSMHYSMKDFAVVMFVILFVGAVSVFFLLNYHGKKQDIDALQISADTHDISEPTLDVSVVDQLDLAVSPDYRDLSQSGMRRYDHPLVAEYYPDDAVSAIPPEPSYTQRAGKGEAPRIAIIIDDMGVNRIQSEAVVDIKDVPLTLAYLPYAQHLNEQTAKARATGHELMIHMPMEPMNLRLDTGPIALKTGMDDQQMLGMLEQAFNSFEGYVGINNHMGSRLTQDRQAMELVMRELSRKGLFYVDSKTIATSVAADAARDEGIAYAERDVFLDHRDTPEFVYAALRKLEKIALEEGSAIAIGHPKAVTVKALKTWLPTLQARGFEIVPVSELLLYPHYPVQQSEKALGANDNNEATKKEALRQKPADERSQATGSGRIKHSYL